MNDLPEKPVFDTLIDSNIEQFVARATDEEIATRGGFRKPDGSPIYDGMADLSVSTVREIRKMIVLERKRIATVDKALAHALSVITRGLS